MAKKSKRKKSRKAFKPKYTLEELLPYTFEYGKGRTEKMIERETGRLLKEAQRKLSLLQKSSFRDSAVARNLERAIAAAQNAGKASRPRIAYELQRLIQHPLSTVYGQQKHRRETIQTLNERGYDFVNARNFKKFTQFMDELRAAGLIKAKGSDPAVAFLRELGNLNGTVEQLKQEFIAWSNAQRP